jgi:GNAT superfamily N-acetyltransferase
MFEIIKTDATHKDFRALVVALDAYLEVTDGEDHAFYDQFNSIDTIKHVLVAYQDTVPVGCGAIKVFNKHAVEVKRMYTIPSARGKGVAKKNTS